jgi:NADH-quinone oxidoreductase subunit N
MTAAQDMAMMGADLPRLGPELWLMTLVLILLASGPFFRGGHAAWPTWIAVAGLLAALPLSAVALAWPSRTLMDGTYASDGLAVFIKLFVEVAAIATLLATRDHLRGSTHEVTVPALVVLTSLGGLLLAASVDLVLIVLFLQLTTVASYALVGATKDRAASNEAVLKYFLFAAASGAVMLYGIALLYALTGTLDTVRMAKLLAQRDVAVLILGAALFLTGFAFKVTAFPLHWWAPDTYEGAPTPLAGFVSVVPKAAGLAILVRTLVVAFGLAGAWPLIVAVLAAATMTVGNLLALRQRSAKRLLAYSSIAQAGYVLMAVVVARGVPLAVPVFAFYLAAYLLMNLPAFIVVGVVERARGSDAVDAFRGLGRASPWLAGAMTLLLLSLGGVPPLLGFAGKVALFLVAMAGGYTWLAVVAAANTALAIYYYLRIISAMYFEDAPPVPLGVERQPSTMVAAVGGAAASLVLGVAPLPLFLVALAAGGILGR